MKLKFSLRLVPDFDNAVLPDEMLRYQIVHGDVKVMDELCKADAVKAANAMNFMQLSLSEARDWASRFVRSVPIDEFAGYMLDVAPGKLIGEPVGMTQPELAFYNFRVARNRADQEKIHDGGR